MQNYFEIHASLYKLWSAQIRTDAQMHAHSPNKNCNNYVSLTRKQARQKYLRCPNFCNFYGTFLSQQTADIANSLGYGQQHGKRVGISQLVQTYGCFKIHILFVNNKGC